MSCAQTENLQICKGKTYSKVIRWEAEPFVYVPITAITKSAPARVTAAAHGIPDGWRVAVVSAGGMTQINAKYDPPKSIDFKIATAIDANTIEFNRLNSSGFKPYTSGGYLQFYTPVDLVGFTARMSIKDRVGGTELMLLTDALEIVLDAADSSITIQLEASVTESLIWKTGVYDLELVSPQGDVTALIEGAVTVTEEVTV